MSNFTGFDPGQSAIELHLMGEQLEKVIDLFLAPNMTLFNMEEDGLQLVWCSPNAVQFSDVYTDKIRELYKKLYYDFKDRYDKTRKAYYIIAARNNVSESDASYYAHQAPIHLSGGHEGISLMPLMEKSPSGAVGINVAKAQEVLAKYNKGKEDCINAMNAIPTTISFYDDEGSQQNAFENKLNELKKEVSNFFDEIANEINNAINNEITKDLEAKQQVVSTLNG